MTTDWLMGWRKAAAIAAGFALGGAAIYASVSTATQVVPGKLVVIMLENHSAAEAVSQMPYLDSLAQTYASASGYHGYTHPSLPNYLTVAAGTSAGTSGDCSPAPGCQVTGPSVFGETLTAGEPAAVYAEDMPVPCDTAYAGNYAPRHNPWVYFPAETTVCQAHDLPLSRLQSDVSAGQLPVTGMVIPNLCDDAHNCPLSQADSWLRQWVPVLTSGPDWSSGRLTVIITADEDDGSQANTVPFVVLNRQLHHVQASGDWNHCYLSRWLADNAGIIPLGCAAHAPGLAAAFGLGG